MRDVFQGNFGGQKNGNKKSTCLQYSFYFVMSKGDIYNQRKNKIYTYIIYIYWIEQELFVCVCHQWVIKQTCKSLFRHVFCPFLGGFNSAAVEGISLKVKLRGVSGFHSLNLDGNWSKKNMFKERKSQMCRDLYKLSPITPWNWKIDGPLGPPQDELPFQLGRVLLKQSIPNFAGGIQVNLYVWHGDFYDLS